MAEESKNQVEEEQNEEPIFPIEEFVGEVEKQDKPTSSAPGAKAPGTEEQSKASHSPASQDANQIKTQGVPPPPPVPRANPDKKGLFGVFRKNKKEGVKEVGTSAPQKQATGSAAIIKRGSGVSRAIIIILLILVTGAVVFFVFFYRVTIAISVKPIPDSITIDSEVVTSGQHKINPGFHSIKVEKAGYVSYYTSRKFSIGEKLDLSFNLKKATSASLVIDGAKSISQSKSGSFLNFLGADARLYSVSLDKEGSEPIALALEQFPSARQVIFARDNNFALILDSEALKIADFAKLDPTKQEDSTALPPAASAIQSVSWNNNASSYVKTANSKILYDLKSTTSWDLFLIDKASGQSQVIMRIDPSRFSNINIDWGESAKTALIVGGEAGLLDIGTREYTALEENGNFKSGKWGPEGKYALLQKSDGSVFILRDGKLENLNIKAKAFAFKSQNEAYIIDGDKTILINFDTNSRINYAEVSGLGNAISFIVSSDNIYFLDSSGIKTAKLQQGAYEEKAN